jgi:hypothetical protein
LVPLQNPLIRYFSGLIFYLLLPLTMLLFAWKAAVFPAWGSGLLIVATAVVASHLMLPLKKFSWRSKALLSTGAAIVVLAMISDEPVRRPFELSRVNLSGHWLEGDDFGGAHLRGANLSGANLYGANLSGANLDGANLTGTDLSVANLTGARLFGAKLSGTNLFTATLSGADLYAADLSGANLDSADLSGAYLYGAMNLTQEQLDEACGGNADTKLTEGLTIKVCNPKLQVQTD